MIRRWIASSGPPASGIQTALVVGWTMMETVALLGLILVILGNSLSAGIVSAAAAFAGLLCMRPGSREWLRIELEMRTQH